MVFYLVLRSPPKLFFDQVRTFLIWLKIALKPSKTFSFIKTIILNSYKDVWKNFFSMVRPLVLWSPLKFFFWPILKIFNLSSNCLKTIKNVFFHQNNHFELIETRFEKIFFQWSPLSSYGHPLNFLSIYFKNF